MVCVKSKGLVILVLVLAAEAISVHTTTSLMLALPFLAQGKQDQDQTQLVQSQGVIGTDDMKDLVDPAVSLATRTRGQKSDVAFLDACQLNCVGATCTVLAAVPAGCPSTASRRAQHYCNDQKFLDQLQPAFCSGTFIGGTTVLTAGHCVDAASLLDHPQANIRVVFNFYLDNTATNALHTIAATDVFTITSIDAILSEGSFNDYARITLSGAPPVDRAAVVRRDMSALKLNDQVFVIGHPEGMPTKATEADSIIVQTVANGFQSLADTMGGSSGGGVYLKTSGDLIGIHVGGLDTRKRVGGCWKVVPVNRTIENSNDHALACRAVVGGCTGFPVPQTAPVPAISEPSSDLSSLDIGLIVVVVISVVVVAFLIYMLVRSRRANQPVQYSLVPTTNPDDV